MLNLKKKPNMKKKEIISKFKILSSDTKDGFEKIFSDKGKDVIFDRLEKIIDEPISKVQLNQLFTLSGLPSMTFGFFKYYWLTVPPLSVVCNPVKCNLEAKMKEFC